MTEPSRCPWCNGVLTADVERCPSCGASLREPQPVEPASPAVPGVTQIDPALARRRPVGRSSLMGWLTGEVDTTDLPPGEIADPASVGPPTEAVRREMLRIQMETLRAELEAETARVKSQAALASAAAAGTVPEGTAPLEDLSATRVPVDEPSTPLDEAAT
jgi:hypothetical protein